MANWLLYPIAIYLCLLAANYLLVFQRIFKTALQFPRYTFKANEAVPDYFPELFQVPTATLEALGFCICSYMQVEPAVYRGEAANWELLLHNAEAKTYATIAIRYPIEPVNPFDIEFLTFFVDRTLLLTMNGKQHALLGDIPNTIVVDPYAIHLAGQWQAHQAQLAPLMATKIPSELAPNALIKALETHFGGQIEALLKTHQISPVPGTSQFQFDWRAALSLTHKLRQGTGKATTIVRQRTQHAKMDESLRIDIPIAADVEGFRRMQHVEQGQVKRKLGLWLLVGSLLLSIASFTPLFDPRTLMILIGVLFLHELGHFLAMRLFGYKDTSMFFLPFFGAAVTGRKDDATLTEKVWVLLAGPLPGLLLGIGLTMTATDHAPAWGRDGVWMLIVLNLFNLLPIYPLDGGKIANLLWFSRYPYTDVLFKGFAVVVLLLLGITSPMAIAIAIVVAMTIPTGFRCAKLDTKLRREFPPRSLTDSDTLLHAIFKTIKASGYGTRPFIQRYTIAKDLLQRHRESHARWLTRLGLSVLYGLGLLGGLAGTLQAVTPNWHRLIAATVTDPSARLQQTIAAADATLARNPDDVQAHLVRGRSRLLLHDYTGAIADGTQLIRLQPQAPMGYFIRGSARRNLGDIKGGEADLKQATTLGHQRRINEANQMLQRQPNDASAYQRRAAARQQLQDYSGAMADYNQAVRLDAANAWTYVERGTVRQHLRDYRGAIADANQALRLRPKLGRAYDLRADARDQLGDQAGAATDRQMAKKLDWGQNDEL